MCFHRKVASLQPQYRRAGAGQFVQKCRLSRNRSLPTSTAGLHFRRSHSNNNGCVNEHSGSVVMRAEHSLSSAATRQIVHRVIVLLLMVMCVAIVVTLYAEHSNTTIRKLTGGYLAHGHAVTLLNQLQVMPRFVPHRGYQRDSFKFKEFDADGNGCDTREDVLNRDLRNIQHKFGKPCVVLSGDLDDPYTGKHIAFMRGVRTSALVQIDHVVALHNAWNSGAWQWESEKREYFANDPYNLLAVEGKANIEKGDADASQWLPSNHIFRCDYVARQIAVKYKYGLSVTAVEKESMLAVLHECPQQEIPSDAIQ